MLSFRPTRIMIRFLKGTYIRYGVLVIGSVFIIWIGTAQNLSSDTIIVAFGVIAGALIAVPALFVIAFMLYHTLKHGNPFIQDKPDPVIVKHYGVTEKNRKAQVTIRDAVKGDRKVEICPICKEATRCVVSYSRLGSIGFHKIR